MHRRSFLQAAIALPCLAGAGLVRASALPGIDQPPHHAFVDTRFPQARQFTRLFHPRARWLPVDGDVTVPWQWLVRPGLAGRTMRLAGVTAPSFPFCLEILARDRGRPLLQQWRCDHDLVAWSLEVQAHG